VHIVTHLGVVLSPEQIDPQSDIDRCADDDAARRALSSRECAGQSTTEAQLMLTRSRMGSNVVLDAARLGA
jgi:hypothetical protein